jgi:ABC-type multidrug transport system fused ATPase/permease subunit
MSNKTRKQHRLKALTNQVRRLKKRIDKLQKISKQLSGYRLIIFLLILFIGIPVFWVNHQVSYIFIGIVFIIFNILAHFHRRIETSFKKHQHYLEIKTSHIARIELDWKNLPSHSIIQSENQHPFEVDLDITGEKSLQQLMDISVSSSGSQRLKEWLLEVAPDFKTIIERQKSIQEISPLIRFRDKLVLAFKLVSKERLDDKKLLSWLNRSTRDNHLKLVLVLSSIVVGFNWIFLLAHFLFQLPLYFFMISLMTYIIIYFWNHKYYTEFFGEAEFLVEELKKYRTVFSYLEKYPYLENINLKELTNLFRNKKVNPSREIRKLDLIVIAIGLRMNLITGMFLNLALPWDFVFAHRLNICKLKFRDKFPLWLNNIFELEALISLANFAYLNPEYIFPEINKNESSELIFKTEKLGHPLIPFHQKVSNDLSIKKSGEIFLITGSNMSGKSTFLRTVGINLCLAYAGSVVNAELFKTNLYRLFTVIRVNDSLSAGISQFYAEVKRLKQLYDKIHLKGTAPLFFLVDEIYKGTNNKERLLGSRAFIRSLAGMGGLGIVSTHDLELTNLEKEVPDFKNFHFREEVKNGKMIFDYILHPGPCPTTNALKIMELEGLPVEQAT